MTKAILVTDMPSKCGNCCLCYKDNFDTDSWFTYRCKVSSDKVEYEKIYENCPLKPLGKKVEKYGLETWDTRDGIFLCELGLFEKWYGDDEEDE